MTTSGSPAPGGVEAGRPVRSVTVLTGPGLPADPDLLAAVTADACAGLAVTGRFIPAADPAELQTELAAVAAAPDAVAVVLPGPDPAVRALAAGDAPAPERTVWYDPQRVTLDTAGAAVHLAGRGMFGLMSAVRHAYWRVAVPATRVHYGEHPQQWADLRLPAEADASAPLPVAVLLHGGFWQSIWGADLMDALAVDLAGRGFATWNLEYRRPDRHGWDTTTEDVSAGLAHLATLAPTVDPDRVAVIGHSAGGQLALRAAADGSRVQLVVSLAGVLDLVEGDRRGVGFNAIPAVLGGSVDELPERYVESSPITRVPIGVRQLIVQGQQDDLDLRDFNRRYVAAATAAGDDVTYLEQPGDHFAVIDPGAPIWQLVAERLERLLAA